MINILKIIIFCLIFISEMCYANNDYIVENINIKNKTLNCYYNYNNSSDKENEFTVIKESNMYYFFVGKESFYTLSRKPISSYEHKGKLYYLGSLQDKALDFSNRYSICF